MRDAADGEHPDPAIGVGMGGSCPNCRAPVDLGQEFCLECGAAIRFTARQRRQQQQRAEGGTTTASAPAAALRRNRFPWVPFGIVLVLVIAGIAFALTDGGSSASKGKGTATTEPALPTITNSTPTTTSATQTTTLEDCDPTRPITQPAIPSAADATGDPGTTSDPGAFQETDAGTANDRIPSIDAAGADTPSDAAAANSAFDDTPPSSGDAGTVTVDGNGTICTPEDVAANDSGGAASGDPVTPTPGDPATGDPAATTPATTPTTPAATTPAPTTPKGNDDWPAGKNGWTVIVAGYKDDESKARKLAADLVTNGFESGVLFSTNYRSLCPGIWVVFSGFYPARAQAEAHQAKLRAKSYQSTYAREVRSTGAAASDCAT